MRFSETPETVSGSFDSNTARRAGFAPCSPASVTVPSMTSSTLDGSMPTRSSKPSIVCASRLSGRTSRRAPPLRPNGVRTASMITASLMCYLTSTPTMPKPKIEPPSTKRTKKIK